MRRQQVERQIDRSVHGTHLAGRLSESAGKHKDPDHNQKVAMHGATHETARLSAQAQSRNGHEGVGRDDEKHHDEAPLTHLGHKTITHKQGDEQEQGCDSPKAITPTVAGKRMM